ncbi:MAG: stage II sporulation protein M [Bacteroidetes bacterium]|nr:stage II sporulation protein M [Bacteroidota bacterium]
MKEITFLKQNHEKWQQFEKLLNSNEGQNPDALADLFIRITDDLSWAHTFYPGSNTEKYLNGLAAQIHQEIYKNKKEKRSRLITFWTHEIPRTMAKHRLNLLITFLIFGFSVWLGAISAKHDESFVRVILPDSYVDNTLESMKKGDPLAVYKSENHFVMFLGIAMNNSLVALVCIVAGIFGWLGVAFFQFRNGVMLGTFFYFLSAHGFAHEAFLTVWIHGVIEIWCIVVAGAAGMALGNGLWFPGAWPRGVSFMRGAREALKIGVGLIPFFFLAAFFEGFVTRYTEMNDYARMTIIFGSLFFMIWYFIIWPFFADGKFKKNPPLLLYLLGPVPVLMFLGTKLFSKVTVTPRFAFLLLLGLLLLLLPSIGLIMGYVTHNIAEGATYIFFAICFCAGIASILFAFLGRGKVVEEDLTIARKGSGKIDEYERSASAIKV